MKYITLEDIKFSLRDDQFALMERNETSFSFFEELSMATVKTFINGIYDLDIEFQRVGDERNHYILKCVLSIFVWELYNRNSNTVVPNNIQVKYDESIKLLKEAGTNKQPLYNLVKRSIELDPQRNNYRVYKFNPKENKFW